MIEKLLKNILDDDGKTKIDINEIARVVNGNVELLGDLVDWEIGSNSNGTYFKHPNGLLICLREVLVNRNTTSVQTIEYPAEFKKGTFPVVGGSNRVGSLGNYPQNVGSMQVMSSANSTWHVRFMSATTDNTDLPIYLLAVGLQQSRSD